MNPCQGQEKQSALDNWMMRTVSASDLTYRPFETVKAAWDAAWQASRADVEKKNTELQALLAKVHIEAYGGELSGETWDEIDSAVKGQERTVLKITIPPESQSEFTVTEILVGDRVLLTSDPYDQLFADAMRYRFLRPGMLKSMGKRGSVFADVLGRQVVTAEDLDAAIDVAITKAQEVQL